ncbi:DUF6292 family protein [Streptomyces sp. AK02-04a]|uniref:DUF6292 family protein n=1 Tax=Streptomyces sp. AK02-04a TaxID=3028649 RepID=UPI0029BCB052|nr:DUF6292 family protein [Streptomyces sp. AK02-04a]MDX3763989.1 DUF6292 family protein [Streptomyces sp. AK02-04a]
MIEATKNSGWRDLKNKLETRVGHYMAAVAERLLDDGLPVSSLYAYAAYDEEEISGADVEGSIHFNRVFQLSLQGSAETFLHWLGTSGWCCRTIPDANGANPPSERTRWLRSGLLPSPERVAAFVSAIRVDPDTAGSDERPSYRASCDQLHEFEAKFRRYAPGPTHSPLAHANYEYRFEEAQGRAYRDRVMKALRSGDDRILFLPIRNSELHALRHLLDYTEAIGPLTGPDDLAHSLAQDLCQRTPGDYQSVHRFGQAHYLANLQDDQDRRA